MTNSKESTTKNKLEDLDPRCCQTACPDCPYGFHDEIDPDVPVELQKRDKSSDIPEEYLKYIEIAEG